MIISILGLIPVYIYKDQHPTNLILLAGWVRMKSAAPQACNVMHACITPNPSLMKIIQHYLDKLSHDAHGCFPPSVFVQTGAFSVTVGLACTFYAPAIVVQAVLITAGVVAGLTAYTFWATKRGVEFTWVNFHLHDLFRCKYYLFSQ